MVSLHYEVIDLKCPICGTALPLQSDRCPDCGYRCRVSQPRNPQPQTTQTRSAVSGIPYTPPKTKPRRGCCCALAIVIPIVILAVVVFFSAVSFIVTDFSSELFEDVIEAAPFEEPAPEPLPSLADEGCFALAEGPLMFLPESWDGSPVLNVPGTIGGQTVTGIGPGGLAGCDTQTTILLPESVESIGPMAFSGCSSLLGLHLPGGVVTIGPGAFSGCDDLQAITVPTSLEHIAPGAFDDCASLLYIFYDGTYEDWNALYSDFINPFTAVICLDGVFYQAAQ